MYVFLLNLMMFLIIYLRSHIFQIIFASSEKHSFGTVLVSTIDGYLRALDTFTGKEKWSLKEGIWIVVISTISCYLLILGPVLKAPSNFKKGLSFLPNPQDGSLYSVKDGTLKKLPFSIPQLVHISPSRNREGLLFAGLLPENFFILCHCHCLGTKKDLWVALNPDTGLKIETLSTADMERVCPANNERAVSVNSAVSEAE